MKAIYNAIYAAIFLAFLVKVKEKLVDDSMISIPVYEGDGSDCWGVMVGEKCVFSSYDKERARNVARLIKKALPKTEPRIFEDEDSDVEDHHWCDTGLNMFDAEELRQLLLRSEY